MLPALVALAGCRTPPVPGPQTAAPVARDSTVATVERIPVVISQGPAVSARVPAGEIVGFVLDDSTGQAIPGAQIYTGLTIAQTDSAGRFRLRVRPRDVDTLMVRRIGYQKLRLPARLHRDSGYVAVFALRPEHVLLCGVVVDADPPEPPAVMVALRDAATGAPLAGPATLEVRDGGYVDGSDAVSTAPDRSRWITAARGRAGRYTVTVRSPGYHVWHGETATRARPSCPDEFEAGVLIAWLLPR